MANELKLLKKEIIELKELLAKRGRKIRGLELKSIQQEKDILDVRIELHTHQQIVNAHQI